MATDVSASPQKTVFISAEEFQRMRDNADRWLLQTAIDLPILDSRSDRMRHLAMRCLSRPLTSSGT